MAVKNSKVQSKGAATQNKYAAAIRTEIANKLIEHIASHGREFFKENGVIAYLERDRHGKVWFHDSASMKRVYTHYNGRWRGFSHGGTLQGLIQLLRNYITKGQKISIKYICTKRFDNKSNTWGYTEQAAEDLVNAVKHLPIFTTTN